MQQALHVKSLRQAVLIRVFMSSIDENSQLKTSGSERTHELAGIEILRFLCALAIVIWHYQGFFLNGLDGVQSHWDRSVQPFYGPLQYAYEGGFWAVPVFWGISGFIFYWTYAQQVFDGRVGLGTFAVRRFSRLYPLHFATLMIVVLLQYFYIRANGRYFGYPVSFHAFIEHLFFASNWLTGHAWSFNGPVWSVSVEILIYFLFFAVVRKAGPGPDVAVAVCILSWVLGQVGFNHVIPIDAGVLKCGFCFFAGGFTLWLSRQRFGILVAACVGTLTGVLVELGRIHLDSGIVLVLTICSVTVFARLGELKSASFLRRLAFFGNATYSSYLLHFPIQLGLVMIIDAMGYSRIIFLTHAMFIAYLVLVVGMSLAVYRYFEHPAQKWIRGTVGQWQEQRTALAKSYN